MGKTLLALLVCAVAVTSVEAQDWSLGAGSGPFVFGDFLRRTLRVGNETESGQQTTTLSAATRAGLSVDLERNLSSRFAVRLEGTFTRAPLVVKSGSNDGLELDAGRLNVVTAMLPLVFRINPRGTFRFHVMGGPAYAVYHVKGRTGSGAPLQPFDGTRSRGGVALGGGLDWRFTDRFAIEGQITDVATASPFNQSDVSGGFGRVTILKPHNVHTTVGIRYWF